MIKLSNLTRKRNLIRAAGRRRIFPFQLAYICTSERRIVLLDKYVGTYWLD